MRNIMSAEPYVYPDKPLVRKHDPKGYRTVESYRDWLRDDFNYRCPFSLIRETWVSEKEFEIDHLKPRVTHPDLVLTYENLVYVYHVCNNTKGARELPDPSEVCLSECLEVLPDGKIIHKNEDGRIIVRTLRLDGPIHTQLREKWIWLYQKALSDQELMERLFGVTRNKPDLTSKRPPSGGLI